MQLEQAQKIAAQLVADMSPFCSRIEIAGSIRREQKEVKDIEILVIPRWEQAGGTLALFGDDDEEAPRCNVLYTDWALDSGIRWIKTGTPEVIDWRVNPDGQYWRGVLPRTGMKLDLFIATPDTWGIDLLIRTGSAEFSKAVVTHAKRIDRPCVKGSLTLLGLPRPTPEERDVFDFLNLEYVEPEKRTGWNALRSRRAAA